MEKQKNILGQNLVDFPTFTQTTHNPAIKFTVSSRGIRPDIDMATYLKIFYMYLDIGQIETVFGNTTFPSKLYGGRPYDLTFALTDEHAQNLQELNIGLTLTLTNHYFSEEIYQHSYPLLEKHHKPGNALNIVNDKLARRIRKDFPNYILNASIIKNLHTPEKVKRALDLYDVVVTPMDKNDDDDFLTALPEKKRITLFGNARCAYNCPARTCYVGFSQEIQGKKITSDCSKETIPRPDLGLVFFDLNKFSAMGFDTFKMIPDKSRQPEYEYLARKFQHANHTPQTA